MKVLKVDFYKTRYGGNIYESLIYQLLKDDVNITYKNVFSKKLIFKSIINMFCVSMRNEYDIVIHSFNTSLFLNKKPTKNIIIIHHIDHKFSPFVSKIYQTLLKNLLYYRNKKLHKIVVVSSYWKEYLEKKGFKNISVIYNAFDIHKYDSVNLDEVQAFKNKYNLNDKPIIYIGNAQKKKGVLEVYNILKDMDVYLVTSGKPQIKLDAINLNLTEHEYILLLKASNVVITMSLFLEGWNRTTHEAMLCKTPVIGSGLGGMGELLTGGNQFICNDIRNLKSIVNKALNSPEIGLAGYNYAIQFNYERFKNDWINLISEVYSAK
jgi:glycosyltransferase involved in cell wall biosynthesis